MEDFDAAREAAEKRGPQSFAKLKWRERDLLDELIREEIPRLRSELYEALREASAEGEAAGEARRGALDGPTDG